MGPSAQDDHGKRRDEFQVINSWLSDTRALIAQYKNQRLDVVKWTMTVNLALATASVVAKSPGIFMLFALLAAAIGGGLALHYNRRLTRIRERGNKLTVYVNDNIFRIRDVVGDEIGGRKGAGYDAQEIVWFTLAIILSILPSFLLWAAAQEGLVGTMILFDQGSQNLLSVLGAAFDVAGAVLLARALVFVKSKSLMRQSTSGYGGVSAPLIKMFSDQWIDASFGLSLLLVGFSLQGAAGYGYKSTSVGLFGAGLAILIVVVVTYFIMRRAAIERVFKRACKTMRKPDGSLMWSENEISNLWEAEK